MNVVNGFLMVTVVLAALWWAFVRSHFPRALAVLSLARDPAEQQRSFAFQMERLNTRVREWLADEGVRAEPE
jgi:hypothetical protein